MTDEAGTDFHVETPPRTGGGRVHRDRRKPLPGVLEILIDIGVVVVGIVIALGGQQVVEARRTEHMIETAKRAMRFELIEDDGPQAFLRVAITPCLRRDLDGLRAAIDRHVEPDAFGKLVDAYRPPVWTWDMDAWNSTQSSGVGNMMGSATIMRWADAYDFIPFLQATANQEQDSLNRLARTRYRKARWTSTSVNELSDVVDELDSISKRMANHSATQLLHLQHDGVALPANTRRNLLAQARAAYGDCVVEPQSGAVIAMPGQPG